MLKLMWILSVLFHLMIIFETFSRMNISDTVMLSVSVNSDPEDTNPLLSPDEDNFYFVKTFSEENVGGKMAGQDIWICQKTNDSNWNSAINLKFLSTVDKNEVIGIAANQDTLYLLNTYSGSLRNKWTIVFSVGHDETEWQQPQEFDLSFKNLSDFKGFFVLQDGKVILLSTGGKDSYGLEDLYVYRYHERKWHNPIHLDEIINPEGFEISTFLPNDEKKIFLSSNGHGGYEDADIFMVERLDSTWANSSNPVNLGNKINTERCEAYLSLNNEGKALHAPNFNLSLTTLFSVRIVLNEIVPPSPLIEEKGKVRKEVEQIEKILFTIKLLVLEKEESPENDFFDKVGIASVRIHTGKDGRNRFSIVKLQSFLKAANNLDYYKNMGFTDAFVRCVNQ